MNSTSRLDQVIAQLRQQLTPSYAASLPRSSINAQEVRSSERGAPEPHRNSALSAVKVLKQAGVTEERVLVRRYFEEVLRHELNDRILNDPEFQHSFLNLLSMLEDDHEAWTTCLNCIR